MFCSINILYDPKIFLPATAILVAILLVWAQLWISTAKPKEKKSSCEEEKHPVEFSLGIGLAWSYLAILSALVAFAWAVYSLGVDEKINEPAIALFVTSFSMAVVNIFQSLVSVVIKIIKNQSLFEPLYSAEDLKKLSSCVTKCKCFNEKSWLVVAVVALFSGFILILAFSWVGCWIGDLVAVGIICLGVLISDLFFSRKK